MTKQPLMDPLARKALERLLKSADKHVAGIVKRAPVLTGPALADYRALQSLKAKDEFEAVMAFGQAEGAIRIERPRFDAAGLIDRIELVDAAKLATLLGDVPHASRLAAATKLLDSRRSAFPVLEEVFSHWERIKRVRGSGPDDADSWAQACDVIDFCRSYVASGDMETPVRDASARLFKDSKRIEGLVPLLDVLLSCSIQGWPRTEAEVLQELGLFREEQPARLAGNVIVRRERGAFPLDRPYCGLPPSTVLALDSVPSRILTIENLTTFHSWARQFCDDDALCIYTGGMPSPAWCAMYVRLLSGLPHGIDVQHWGDVDEGGFRIAAFLSRRAAEAGHRLQPWKMRPSDIPPSLRRSAEPYVVERMSKFAIAAGWQDMVAELTDAKVVAEQEG